MKLLYRDKNWLYRKYKNEEFSTRRIAKLCKVSHWTIQYWLKKYNIRTRTLEQAVFLHSPKRKNLILDYRNYKWLNQKYVIEGFSMRKIAKICGVCYDTIRRCLYKFHIRIRTFSESRKMHDLKNPNARKSENCPSWKGGKKKSGGYILIKHHNHPYTNISNYIFEHRNVTIIYKGAF